MQTFIELSKIYVPLFIVIGGILTVLLKSLKKKDDALVLFVEKFSEGQSQLSNDIGELLKGLDKHINPVIITCNNSANIIKDAIFAKQGIEFVKLMTEVYKENGLNDTNRTLSKIKAKTVDMLHRTDQKLRVIKGMQNYVVDFGLFIHDVEDSGVYNIVLELMRKTKETKDIEKLKYELTETYQIALQSLNEKYTF